ncbi:MAG TPA: transcription termination factor Rho [Planctomycetaceae bacterium]|nr:transcription termination factor Rho [Planctomycetaceae bacterium]
MVDSVVIVSPASFPDPPAERPGRARSQEDQFGANAGDEIVFPEDNSSGTPAASSPPPATTEGGVDSRRGGYLNQRGGYSDQENAGVSDRGDGVDEIGPRRRRRRRRRGGNGEDTRANGQQRDFGQQRSYGQQRQPGQQRQFGQPRQYGPQRQYGQRDYGPQRDQYRQQNARPRSDEVGPDEQTSIMDGVLELHPKGYGFLRDPKKNYSSQESDPFVSSSLIEKAGLREGVTVRGAVGSGSRGQGPRLKSVELIDGMSVEDYVKIKSFDDLTAITPYTRLKLEVGSRPITMRVMDLLTPVGKGQRALIVAPPRTGKTMLLQEIADSISTNHPEVHLMVLLIDERPEEVTEMRRHVKGEVIASSMDREVENHVRISQLLIERAKRLAEEGKDVFILMDSVTRAARAFNKWTNTGRTATGGLDVRALDIPKKMFGSARQFDEGGSLTIVATALIDTGSRADEAIFQEFKGTGNMELVLSRDLADRRIWPAIDITKSGTRHEEKLYDPRQFESIVMLRRSLISLSPIEAMEQLARTLERFPSNNEFLEKVKSVL